MGKIFDACVGPVEFLAPRLGIIYEELNVWLFVIMMPGIILVLVILCRYLRLELAVGVGGGGVIYLVR
jgi:hypothetical protein